MDNAKKKKIWEEIIQATKKENTSREPDEYTWMEFVKQVRESGGPDLSSDRARRMLNSLVKLGKLKVRRTYLKEYRAVCVLYSPVDENS